MKSREKKKSPLQNKPVFEEPAAEIIILDSSDVITASGNDDDHLGEWDQQF